MLGRSKKLRAEHSSLKKLGISLDQVSATSQQVVTTLQKKGYEAYVVGGAVRDLLLGLHPRDFDVVTSAHPEQIKKCFRRAWIIGRRFQLVHVRLGSDLVEVSTFRSDPARSGFFASKQRLSENQFGTIETDVLLRDLTINALYLDPTAKKVIDYVEGVADARNRVLKLIGKPKERYKRDPVRMIRILRLAAKLDCSLDPRSTGPIKKNAGLLDEIAQSRLLEEFIKAVSSGFSAKSFELLSEFGIVSYLFPHLAKINKDTKRFIELALIHNDRLIHRNERSSLSSLICSLYWPTISAQWNEACAEGKSNMNLIHDLFNECGIRENRILTHSLRAHVQKIWEYQSRFQRQKGRAKALTMKLNNYSAQKALAFLELRLESGEIDSDLTDWWVSFAEADPEERGKMVAQKKKRRTHTRRRKKALGTRTQAAETGNEPTDSGD